MLKSPQPLSSFCESFFLKGKLLQINRKKSGRYSSIHLQTKSGRQVLKVSKYFRFTQGISPDVNDAVVLKVFKKVKSGKEKLTVFGMKRLEAHELYDLEQSLEPLPQEGEVVELAICQSKSCLKHGASRLMDVLKAEAQVGGVKIHLSTSSCLGQCKFGPVAECSTTGQIFQQLSLPKVKALLTGTLIN